MINMHYLRIFQITFKAILDKLMPTVMGILYIQSHIQFNEIYMSISHIYYSCRTQIAIKFTEVS